MSKITISKCFMEGLYIIEPTLYTDLRGYFMETFNKEELKAAGINCEYVQDNQSFSKKGVLRGLHFQRKFPQEKIVRVISGEIFDVVVDIRTSSETFGSWYGVYLSDTNNKQLYIGKGFAHGFLTLSDQAIVSYKVSEGYHPEDECGIVWNDPKININWPLEQSNSLELRSVMKDGTRLTISDKDNNWRTLDEIIEIL